MIAEKVVSCLFVSEEETETKCRAQSEFFERLTDLQRHSDSAETTTFFCPGHQIIAGLSRWGFGRANLFSFLFRIDGVGSQLLLSVVKEKLEGLPRAKAIFVESTSDKSNECFRVCTAMRDSQKDG